MDNDGRLELLLGDSVTMVVPQVGFPVGLTRSPQEILIWFEEDRIEAIREA